MRVCVRERSVLFHNTVNCQHYIQCWQSINDCMEHLWNTTGREKEKHPQTFLSHCHSVHHELHVTWHSIKSWPYPWKTSDCLNHGARGVCVCVFFNNFIDVQHVPLQVILHAPVVLLIHELHNICLDWIQSFDLVLCVFLVILVVL